MAISLGIFPIFRQTSINLVILVCINVTNIMNLSAQVIAASTPTATQTKEGHQPIPQISTDQHRPREMAMTAPPSLTIINWRKQIQQETITYCHTYLMILDDYILIHFVHLYLPARIFEKLST